MMDTATVTTLPATGREVPAEIAAFAVTGLKQMETYDGVAFNATLRCDGKIVGAFENDGRGGSTLMRPKTGDARVRWDEAVATIGDFTEDHGDFTIDYTERWAKAEVAAEWLIAEYEEAKWLNREAKKGTVIRRADGQLVTYTTADTARIAKAEGVAEITVWAAGGWQTR